MKNRSVNNGLSGWTQCKSIITLGVQFTKLITVITIISQVSRIRYRKAGCDVPGNTVRGRVRLTPIPMHRELVFSGLAWKHARQKLTIS